MRKFLSTVNMMKNFRKVTHVIFDMDGVIIDSETSYKRVINTIANKYGKDYTDEVRMKVLGTPEQETARIAVEEMKLPITTEQFITDFRSLVKQEIQHPPLLEGAASLIKHLHLNKVPIAVATSSSNESMVIKTQDHQELFELFHHKVMGSSDPEVKNGKPHPDIFLVCASRFPDKPNPENCLVFEDAPNGVTGARAAGMQVVMVPEKIVDRKLCEHATVVLDSLLEFKPEWFSLPPYEKSECTKRN